MDADLGAVEVAAEVAADLVAVAVAVEAPEGSTLRTIAIALRLLLLGGTFLIT